MPNINIYKIHEDKRLNFMTEVGKNTNKRKTHTSRVANKDFELTLYVSRNKRAQNISWAWALQLFNHSVIKTKPQKYGIILITNLLDNHLYAITFGSAHFLVDKFCDRNFAFDYARKVKFSGVKTNSLLLPSNQKNKLINTYIDFNELEFDSGESCAKLKASLELPEGFSLYKPVLEIGTSIKFSISDTNIDTFCKIIYKIEQTLKFAQDKQKIPFYREITNVEQKEILETALLDAIKENIYKINFTEFQIVGVNEVFNWNYDEFHISYNRKEEIVTQLNEETIRTYCIKHNLEYAKVVLNIKIKVFRDGQSLFTTTVKEHIDYINESERVLLVKGKWYMFNDDYLEFLHESLKNLEIYYDSNFDFSSTELTQYQNAKFLEEKGDSKYRGKTDKEIKTSIEKKYYAEKVYNCLREENDGFTNLDRDIVNIEKQKFEVADLFRNSTIFAVKIGNSSAKLSYVVDQSVLTLNLYKNSKLPNTVNEFKNVALWIVLDRVTTLPYHEEPNEDGSQKPDISKLEMLILKNKIVEWRKTVYSLGKTPQIYINYRK